MSTSNLVNFTEHAYGLGMGKGKIKFTRQYQPVNFRDRPLTKTVDGKGIAAIRAAEERRFEQIVRERIAEEFDSRWRRLMRHVVDTENRFVLGNVIEDWWSRIRGRRERTR